MSTANINNNQPITCHRSLERLFLALSQERNLRLETYSCSWIIMLPTLPQPGLSCYSEASARKRADELSWVINSIDDSVNFKCRYSRPVDRFNPKLDRQKGEDLRRSQARYRVRSSVASAREIKKSLNSATMTLLGITRHNVHALYWHF